jgi:hypothetical protein
MCCFSGRVEKVADTNIFARASKGAFARGNKLNKQVLVYAMFVAMKEDLAMILPIPTPKASKEDAVRFVSLKEYPEFFADMQKGFPIPPAASDEGGRGKLAAKVEKPLKVVPVGAFEASFVPAVNDFARLDQRFRLPAATWDSLPAYKDYGFVVFKLKKGESKVHPMAFEFPRADKTKLFFPTVHIHDGKIHETAEVDHALYCQTSGEDTTDWTESPQPAGFFVNTEKAAGLVEKESHVYQQKIVGRKPNQDTWVV